MLGSEHSAIIVTEESTNGRIVLVKTVLNRRQEGIRRRLGQQPKVTRQRPPPSLIGIPQQLADDSVDSPTCVGNDPSAIAPKRKQDEYLTNAVTEHS